MKKLLTRILAAAVAALMLAGMIPAVGAADTDVSLSDFSGKGMVIAVIDGGFDVEHEVFATAPAEPRLKKSDADLLGFGRYVSTKIPYAYDYADGDADVFNPGGNLYGTACASIAAGMHDGGPDVKNEDGTVTHPASYRGAAPDAQLLLMKAAVDDGDGVDPVSATQAVRDAVTLGADVICLSWRLFGVTDELNAAVRAARRAGVTVFTGAGVMDMELQMDWFDAFDMFPDALCAADALEGVTVVSAARDAYKNVNFCTVCKGYDLPEYNSEAFFLINAEITYTDSCEDYLGAPFAKFMAGGTYEIVAVPGDGAAEDYEQIDVRGKIALVERGGMSFTEKSQYAAAAGAVAMIVYNNVPEETFRMSIPDAGLPCVSIVREIGIELAEMAEGMKVTLTFHKSALGRVDNAGTGFTPSGKSVDFLADGENVPIAYSGETTKYNTATGTAFAAAVASGAAACAKEYCAANDLLRTDTAGAAANADAVLAVLRSACDVLDLPVTAVGAGHLKLDKPLPRLRASASAPVPLTMKVRGTSARNEVTLTNPSAYPMRVGVRAETVIPAIDQNGFFDVRMETVEDAVVRSGDSLRDLTEEPYSFTLKGGQTMTLTFSTLLPDETRDAIAEDWPSGFWLETRLCFTTDTEDQTLISAAYYGDWESRPFARPSIFDTNSYATSGADLYFYEYSEQDDLYYPYLVGTEERWEAPPSDATFTTALNLVSSAKFLEGGWISLGLDLIRSCDAITIRVTDADGYVVHERVRGGEESVPLSGPVRVPLWDFRAEDLEDYVFPDGDYTIEVILHAGKASQTYTFPFTIDSVRPTVEYTMKKEGGRELLTVTAKDDRALWDLYATDMQTVFSGDAPTPCDPSFSCVIDVTDRNPAMPLYLECVDYAGNTRIVRVTP